MGLVYSAGGDCADLFQGFAGLPAATAEFQFIPRAGQRAGGGPIESEVDATVMALLEIAKGAVVTPPMSWDMGPERRVPIEIYGSAFSLLKPGPNWSSCGIQRAQTKVTFAVCQLSSSRMKLERTKVPY